MLDVENVKTILQSELNKREKSKIKLIAYQKSNDKFHEEYEKMTYHKHWSRYQGMCDMLTALGYYIYCDDDNNVFVYDVPF